MKHKAFETWILSDRDLSPEEQKALYDHLIECSDCDRLDKNLRAVEHLLWTTPQAAPAPGFSGRFQARLVQEARWTRNRQNLYMLLGTSLAAGVFLWLTGLQFLLRLDTFIVETLGGLTAIGGFAGQMSTAFSMQGGSGLAVPPLLPALLIMAGFAAAGAAVVLWMKMFRTFARHVGLTQWA